MMSWICSLFSVSWAALGSSLLLIAWGLQHRPWRKEHRFDGVMLLLLGGIDWSYAAQSHVEIQKIQEVVAPRHLTKDQRAMFVAALGKFRKPTERVWIIINTDGTPRARNEQVDFAHEIEATLDEAGWPYRETAGPSQPAGIGVELSLPPLPPDIVQTQDVYGYSPLGLMDAFRRSGLAFQLRHDPPPDDQIIRVYVWRQL